ncbi:MAG: hypothetical protein AAF614_34965 [Chloroflexota bacterium]
MARDSSTRWVVARLRGKSSISKVGEQRTAVGEVFTTSPVNKGRDAWLQRTIANSGQNLATVRERIFELAGVQRHHLVLDLAAGSGLLTWEAVRQAPEGGVWALTAVSKSFEALRQLAERMPELERPIVLMGSGLELEHLLALRGESDVRFDRIVGRNLFTQTAHEAGATLAEVRKWVGENGRFVFSQVIPQHGQRLYNLVDWTSQPASLREKVVAAEEAIYTNPDDSLVNWDEQLLVAGLEASGWGEIDGFLEEQTEQRRVTAAQLERWFGEGAKGKRGNGRLTYRQRLHKVGLTAAEMQQVEKLYRRQLQQQLVAWQTTLLYLVAQ